MKKIVRKVYDESGTETSALGLPCKTVTDYWNGSIDSDGVHIDDAFDIEEVDITDDHSTGLVALVGEIAKVQQQERCMPSDILMPTIKGFPIDSEGKTDISADEVEDTLTEVTPVEPIYIEGVLVKHLYKSSGEVSYLEPSDSALMDGRKSMAGYTTEHAADVVYKILPASYATDQIKALLGVSEVKDDVSVDAESGMFDAGCEITAKSNYLLGTFARVNLDAILGISGICVGIGGGVAEWMITAHVTYGIPLANLVKAMNEYTFVNYLYSDGNQRITLPNVDSNTIKITTIYELGSSCVSGQEYCISGNLKSIGSEGYLIGEYLNSYIELYSSKNQKVLTKSIVSNEKRKVKFEINSTTKSIKYNDDTVSDTYIAPIINNYRHDLFGRGEFGNSTFIGSIYSYILEMSSKYCFFSCINSNGTYGMLELINYKFYENDGTGTFSVGNTVSLKDKFTELNS